MNIIVEPNYEAFSRRAATIFLHHISRPQRVNVALTGGRTPYRMNEIIAHAINETSLATYDTHYYMQDEDISCYDETYFRIYASQKESFYDKLDEMPPHVYRLLPENYEGYADMIQAHGGIDLLVSGLGGDGHVGANNPGAPFKSQPYMVTREPRPPKDENTYTHQIALGMDTIMQARMILLIANGQEKADMLRRALEGDITRDVPASLLQLHPNLTVVCDKAAASLLSI